MQRGAHSCLWNLDLSSWSAELELGVEELSVRWSTSAGPVERHFPYGFSRADVEAAILAGP